MRHYEIPLVSEAHVLKKDIEFNEIGPHFDMTMRRSQMSSMDLFKTACKKPKMVNMDKKRVSLEILNFQANKNVFYNEIGDKKAKVFIQEQDYSTMAIRKYSKVLRYY